MQKLDWYIIKKFLGTFFFALALILLIVIVFDISEKIDDFLEHEVRIKSIIFDYYFNFNRSRTHDRSNFKWSTESNTRTSSDPSR